MIYCNCVWPQLTTLTMDNFITKVYHLTLIPRAVGIQVYMHVQLLCTRTEPNWFPIKKLNVGFLKLKLHVGFCCQVTFVSPRTSATNLFLNLVIGLITRLIEMIWPTAFVKTHTLTLSSCNITLTEALSLSNLHCGTWNFPSNRLTMKPTHLSVWQDSKQHFYIQNNPCLLNTEIPSSIYIVDNSDALSS